MGNDGSLWQHLQRFNAADEQTLVAAAGAGEALAQRVLLERYLPLMYSVCRRYGLKTQDAEDVTQEVVVKVLRALPGFRAEAKLSSWIYTVAQRAVCDFFRHRNRREQPHDFSDPQQQTLLDNAALMGQSGSDRHPDRNADNRDADTLTQVMAGFSEPMRSVLLRFYLADETVAEIAQALDLAEGTVKSHLHRGRQLLRQKVESKHEG